MESTRNAKVQKLGLRPVLRACLVVVLAAVLASVEGCGGTTTSTNGHFASGTLALSGSTGPRTTLGGKTHRETSRDWYREHRVRGAPGRPLRATRPGQILHGDPLSAISSDEIADVSNSWLTESHRRFTAVEAGVSPRDSSVGMLGVFRQNYVWVTQRTDIVRVPNAGRLTITKAPIGRGVVVSAQKGGEIQFTGAKGLRGTLHLSDDSVTLQVTGG
jgi:hypothetical protein